MNDFYRPSNSDIPGPEEITNADLILSANRALICSIWPNMREVAVEFIKEKKLIILHFCYDKPLSREELDFEQPWAITCEMGCDFSEEIQWEHRVVVIPYPEKRPDVGICVFSRYEPPPPGVDDH